MSSTGEKGGRRDQVPNPGGIRPNILLLRPKFMFGPAGCVGGRTDARLRTQEAEGREREERRRMSPNGEKRLRGDQGETENHFRPAKCYFSPAGGVGGGTDTRAHEIAKEAEGREGEEGRRMAPNGEKRLRGDRVRTQNYFRPPKIDFWSGGLGGLAAGWRAEDVGTGGAEERGETTGVS